MSNDPPPQAQLGPYRVLAILGRGGMATVFRATDERNGQQVAVKMMAPGYLKRKDMALRFRREFRAIQRLAHPNIVRVLECGEDAGRFFFAMELVDGNDLADLFALKPAGGSIHPRVLADPTRVRRTLDIAAQVTEALYYIHSHRIVHRDMKPGNVVVNTKGTAKLMDFGIAKELDQSAALTRDGSFLGTAYYTAPEQIKASRELDGRADLYGFGVMLYEILAGRLPFYSENTVEVLKMHIMDPPVPPRTLNPQIPADVANILLKLLAKDPVDRYRDAGELLGALRACDAFPTDRETREWKEPAPLPAPLLTVGLIDRKKELSKLIDALDAASVGQPVLAVVTGPLGIGKTRLLRGLEENSTTNDCTFLWGSFVETRTTPYRAWGEALAEGMRLLGRLPPGPDRREFVEIAPILATVFPSFEQMAQGRPAPIRLAPRDERLRLFAAVLSCWKLLAASTPLVLLLDNHQFADGADIALLWHLLDGVSTNESGCRLMVVVLSRRADEAKRIAPSGTPPGLRRVNLALAPFDQEDVRQLLLAISGNAAALGGAKKLNDLVSSIMEETRGNPYHVEEIAKSIASGLSGGVPHIGDSGGRASTGETTRRGVEGILKTRLRSLSPEARHVLQAAAVMTDGIEFGRLAELSATAEDQLLDLLDELIRSRFLVEKERGSCFEFYQGLVRNAVYESIDVAERRRLHHSYARLLRPLAAQDPTTWAAAYARHAEEGGDVTGAIHAYLTAGDAALSGNRVDHAERYFRRAEELGSGEAQATDLSNTSELELNLRRGSLLLAKGHSTEASKLLETTVIGAKEKGMRHLAATAARQLGKAYALEGNNVLAVANLEWTIEVGRLLDDKSILADARNALAEVRLARGNLDKALRDFTEALGLHRELGYKVGATRALRGAGEALGKKGDLGAAMKMLQDALRFSRDLEETGGQAQVYADMAALSFTLGRKQEAASHLTNALALARKAGLQKVEFDVACGQARLALAKGDLARAFRRTAFATECAASQNDNVLRSRAALLRGSLELFCHQQKAAKASYTEARQLSKALGNRPLRAASARALATLAGCSRAFSTAREYLNEAHSTHQRTGARIEQIVDHVTMTELLTEMALAHECSAAELHEQLDRHREERSILSREGVKPLEAFALYIEARAALALGRREQAEQRAAEAIATASAAGREEILLRASIRRVEALAGLGRGREAGEACRGAIKRMKRMAASLVDRSARLTFLADPERRLLVRLARRLSQRH